MGAWAYRKKESRDIGGAYHREGRGPWWGRGRGTPPGRGASGAGTRPGEKRPRRRRRLRSPTRCRLVSAAGSPSTQCPLLGRGAGQHGDTAGGGGDRMGTPLAWGAGGPGERLPASEPQFPSVSSAFSYGDRRGGTECSGHSLSPLSPRW
jgi:hypothetical protein